MSGELRTQRTFPGWKNTIVAPDPFYPVQISASLTSKVLELLQL